MTFPCERCGACCRAVKCDKLVMNRCTIYDTRPLICRVDDIIKLSGLQDDISTLYETQKHACRNLREDY